ncbi:MAG: ABC transporter ATP-binding protein [Eubacteriaceae bacterium]|nr:ABC transporter ATP-binding protein [Eubacteriaceae bacterium]
MIVLEGIGLKKDYKVEDTVVHALRGVDMRLEKGEVLGIVGESGSGKSTMLRLLSGLENPTEGEIILNGKKLSGKRTKEDLRTMQMIFQDAVGSFHPRRTVSDSIDEAVRSLCGRGQTADKNELCELVGLAPELVNRLPRHLSGGQCQRLAIARAVAVKPDILLCDEVTSALDVSSQAQVLKLLSEICRDRQMSAVFVSHDLAVVSCLCDRIMVMKDGSLVEEGPVRKIIEQPEQEYTQKLLDSVMEI